MVVLMKILDVLFCKWVGDRKGSACTRGNYSGNCGGKGGEGVCIQLCVYIVACVCVCVYMCVCACLCVAMCVN